jgi:hypothetical protein
MASNFSWSRKLAFCFFIIIGGGGGFGGGD